MATFVWVGNDTAHGAPVHTDVSGVSGATYGDWEYLSHDNWWNDKRNWRERISAGDTGASGGYRGSTGSPGTFYYIQAQRRPAGGDVAIFEGLTANALDGITQDYPISECLYGGISGSQGWYNPDQLSLIDNDNIDILVKNSYFDGRNISKMPLNQCRFGTNTSGATGTARGHENGLNIYANNFVSDSRARAAGINSWQTRVGLHGRMTKIENFSMIGHGLYVLGGDYYTNVTLVCEQYYQTPIDGIEGTEAEEYFDIGNAPHIAVLGARIKEYLGIVGMQIRGFLYYPAPVHADKSIDKVVIAPKYINNEEGAITIHGEIGSLEIYPHMNTNCISGQGCGTWSAGPKIALKSFENSYTQGLTYGTVHLKEYNSQWSVPFDKDKYNNRVSFSNVGPATTHIDTINVLNVDAGTFETDSLSGKLNILSGTIQIDGTVDFRAMESTGQIEVAGTSGGIKGNGLDDDGLFVASPDSTIYPPAGSSVSFREYTGGATGAIQSSVGAALTKGGGAAIRRG